MNHWTVPVEWNGGMHFSLYSCLLSTEKDIVTVNWGIIGHLRVNG